MICLSSHSWCLVNAKQSGFRAHALHYCAHGPQVANIVWVHQSMLTLSSTYLMGPSSSLHPSAQIPALTTLNRNSAESSACFWYSDSMGSFVTLVTGSHYKIGHASIDYPSFSAMIVFNAIMLKAEAASLPLKYPGYASKDLACVQETVCAHLRTASPCHESSCLPPSTLQLLPPRP